jgi:4-hydroxybenzoyl-CoA reductase subunit gamma
MKRILRIQVNGRWREDAVPDNQLLIDYLREQLQLTGTKQGCDGGECGACTVLVDGRPRLQQAFHEKLGAQCGFCTPGMIMAAEGLLRRNPQPSEAEIREALGGNLCRCTGYVKIIESVQAAAAAQGEPA